MPNSTEKLLEAARANNTEEFIRLAKQPDVDLFYVDNFKRHALIPAIKNKNFVIIKTIIEEGIIKKKDLLSLTNMSNETPLFQSSSSGYLEISKYLLKIYSPALKGASTWTAFDSTKSFYRSSKTSQEKETAVKVLSLLRLPTFVDACRLGYVDVIKKVISNEDLPQTASLNVNDFVVLPATETPSGAPKAPWEGKIGLVVAAENGHVEVVQFLLSQKENLKLDCNKRDESGSSAIHAVLRLPKDASQQKIQERVKIIEMLVKFGNANPNFRTQDNLTPLELAQKTGNPALMAAIQEAIKQYTANAKPAFVPKKVVQENIPEPVYKGKQPAQAQALLKKLYDLEFSEKRNNDLLPIEYFDASFTREEAKRDIENRWRKERATALNFLELYEQNPNNLDLRQTAEDHLRHCENSVSSAFSKPTAPQPAPQFVVKPVHLVYQQPIPAPTQQQRMQPSPQFFQTGGQQPQHPPVYVAQQPVAPQQFYQPYSPQPPQYYQATAASQRYY